MLMVLMEAPACSCSPLLLEAMLLVFDGLPGIFPRHLPHRTALCCIVMLVLFDNFSWGEGGGLLMVIGTCIM